MYFDQYSFNDTSIKSQINSDIYLTLHPNISNNYQYKISQNKVTLLDSWVSDLVPTKEHKFTDVRFAHIQQGFPDKTNSLALLTVDFTIDENISHYTRRV
jgi:hypothetical protein